MKQLPSNCSCTETWAHPENWKTTTAKSALKQNCYVQCDFYNPLFKEKYPKGFPYRKRLNSPKTLQLRKASVEYYLTEMIELLEKGYNPITKTYMIEQVPDPAPVLTPEIDPEDITTETPFLIALELVYKKLVLVESTFLDIKYMLARFNIAATQLRYDELKISEIQRKHIRFTI